jgi:hypothetical protein
LHADIILIFHEVGKHISQKGDGNAGGQNFMVVRYMRAQFRNSFKDNQFTVLGLIAVDGRAVMCVIIIAASKLKVTDVTGFNPLSKDTEDMSSDEMKVLEADIEKMKDQHSKYVDRMFTFGPAFTFNGTEDPKFVTCSKNGSITSQILTSMLPKWISCHSSDVMATGVGSVIV